MAITSSQCRAARALINLPLQQLAAEAGVPVETLAAFEENTRELSQKDSRAVVQALDARGVTLVGEIRGRGKGVRFKFPRQTARRVEAWENEGGLPGTDAGPQL